MGLCQKKNCCRIFISNINKTKISSDKYAVKSCQHRNTIQISLLAAVLNCNCTVVNSIRSVAGVFISPRAELSFLISMSLISQSIWCLKEIALKDEDDESNINA